MKNLVFALVGGAFLVLCGCSKPAVIDSITITYNKDGIISDTNFDFVNSKPSAAAKQILREEAIYLAREESMKSGATEVKIYLEQHISKERILLKPYTSGEQLRYKQVRSKKLLELFYQNRIVASHRFQDPIEISGRTTSVKLLPNGDYHVFLEASDLLPSNAHKIDRLILVFPYERYGKYDEPPPEPQDKFEIRGVPKIVDNDIHIIAVGQYKLKDRLRGWGKPGSQFPYLEGNLKEYIDIGIPEPIEE